MRTATRLLQCSWQPCSARPRGILVVAMARPWRPDMNDVDRLSRGGAAKKRGTGSFHIPHRLNSDEQPVYAAAKKKGFLQVRGTGYRKGRKGHPLPNIYRQWCDAKAQACIVVEQDAIGGRPDTVVVDLAPLRTARLAWAVEQCCSLAAAAGARRVSFSERPLEAVPFDIVPVDLPLTVMQMLGEHPVDTNPAAAAAPLAHAPTPEQIETAEQLVLQQADSVRQLKATGLSNSSPEVQSQVQVLIKLKAELQDLLDRAAAVERPNASNYTTATNSSSGHVADGPSSGSGSKDERIVLQEDGQEVSSDQRNQSSSREVLPEEHPFTTAAIWQLPVMPLFFEAERSAAKQLAKDIISALAPVKV